MVRYFCILLMIFLPGIVFADTNPKDPAQMVPVPPGWFAFQNNYKSMFHIDAFKIDKYEITNDFYCRFLNDADPCGLHHYPQMQITRQGSLPKYRYSVKTGKERFPVCFVNIDDANAFAAWRGKIYGGAYSLPTELQWEKAAGWDPELKKMFKYGYHSDVIDSTWCNYDNFHGAFSVGSFNGTSGKKDARNFYGCYDMSGNVWEWTTSPYDRTSRVVRGGGFTSEADENCSSTYRGSAHPSSPVDDIGFRLILKQDK